MEKLIIVNLLNISALTNSFVEHSFVCISPICFVSQHHISLSVERGFCHRMYHCGRYHMHHCDTGPYKNLSLHTGYHDVEIYSYEWNQQCKVTYHCSFWTVIIFNLFIYSCYKTGSTVMIIHIVSWGQVPLSRGFCITTYHCGCPHTVSHTSTKTLSWHGAWSVFSTLCTWQELFTAQLWNRKRTFYFLIITFLFCDIHMMSSVVRKQNQFLRSWCPHTTPRIKKGSCPSLNFSAFPNKF